MEIESESLKASENEPPDKYSVKSHKNGIRIVMCLCAFMELLGEAMIMPYYPRAMDISRITKNQKCQV